VSATFAVIIITVITVPAAMVILLLTLRSARLLWIVFFNVVVSILCVWWLLYLCCQLFGLNIDKQTTIEFSHMICLALSLDYSLFMLSTFRSAVKDHGMAHEKAVVHMWEQIAMEVIPISAVTLSGVFLGMLSLNSRLLQIDGLASALAALSAGAVSATLTPALLLCFPTISKFLPDFSCSKCIKGELQEDPSWSAKKVINPAWVRLGRRVTTFPNNIGVIFVVFSLAMPFASVAKRINTSLNVWQLIPRSNPTNAAWTHLVDSQFNLGQFSPSYVMSVQTPGTNLTQVWQETTEIASALVAQGLVAEDKIFSLGFDRGRVVTHAQAAHYLEDPTASSVAAMYAQDFAATMVSSGGNVSRFDSTAITISTDFYPCDYQAKGWLTAVRAVASGVQKAGSRQTDHHWIVWNSEVVDTDRMSVEWDQFEKQIAVTAAIVLVLISIMLKSAFACVRLALTLFMPLFSVYGLAVLVYQDGILDWTGVAALSSNSGTNSFQQETVIILFSLCLALALDYDIFLLARIRWHRRTYTHRDSIVLALSETGPTISRAGIIMALAFGGEQLYLFMCSCVVVHKVVVRVLRKHRRRCDTFQPGGLDRWHIRNGGYVCYSPLPCPCDLQFVSHANVVANTNERRPQIGRIVALYGCMAAE
jgi:uncharacterized membrane protein YdfJ with MMPL/SSD domain